MLVPLALDNVPWNPLATAIEIQVSSQHHADFRTGLPLRGNRTSASAFRIEQQPTEPSYSHNICHIIIVFIFVIFHQLMIIIIKSKQQSGVKL